MQDNEKKKDYGFTATEVGALVEELRGDIRLLAEGFGVMGGDIRILKDDVSILKTDVSLIKDTFRVTIPDPEKRITRLELKAAG